VLDLAIFGILMVAERCPQVPTLTV